MDYTFFIRIVTIMQVTLSNYVNACYRPSNWPSYFITSKYVMKVKLISKITKIIIRKCTHGFNSWSLFNKGH